MRIFLSASMGLLLCAPLFLPQGAGGEPLDPGPTPPQDPTSGAGDGGPQVCATGCSAAPAVEKDLSAEAFERLLADFATQPMSGESEALEELLFHGDAALALLDTLGSGPELDQERASFLRAELAHTNALLDMRIIDANGVERLHLGQTSVPFGEKQHLHPRETNSLQTPEVSGTVHRVGLKHLWARL